MPAVRVLVMGALSRAVDVAVVDAEEDVAVHVVEEDILDVVGGCLLFLAPVVPDPFARVILGLTRGAGSGTKSS